MKISIVAEGGAGDFVAGLRFFPAIYNQYPTADYVLFSNTDGNESQAKLINTLWPGRFSETHQVTRASQQYKLESGEIYNAAYNNIIEEDRKKIESADLVFNLTIDSLVYPRQIPDFHNYFYKFPAASCDFSFIPNELKHFENEKFILCHLSARDGGGSEIENWYKIRLIKELEKQNPDHLIYLYCQKDRFHIYDKVLSDRVKVFDCKLEELAWVCGLADSFIGIDSAPRYLALSSGKCPAYLLSKFCSAPGVVSPAHLVRWIIFSELCLPLHHDCIDVAKIVTNSIKSFSYCLFGDKIRENIEQVIVERKFVE